MSIQQAFGVFLLGLASGVGLYWGVPAARAAWRSAIRAWFKYCWHDGSRLPPPDRSALRRPVVDPLWDVGKPRARFISSSLQVAALDQARGCKLNHPARRLTPADIEELWDGQEGEI
jgi:hypothetical protein